jgi:hypothetical protein
METYTTINRAELGWPSGPWDGEPDKLVWRDKEAGYPCMIVRTPWNGHLCGYVGVPQGHPDFGKNYDDVDVQVHMGLTFSDSCQEPTLEQYEKFLNPDKDALYKQSVEAANFPDGDSARYVRERCKQLDNCKTFEEWREYQMQRRICHVKWPGETEVWWLGFDCAHCDDTAPGDAARDIKYADNPDWPKWPGGRHGTYKTVDFVKAEITALAIQLKEHV